MLNCKPLLNMLLPDIISTNTNYLHGKRKHHSHRTHICTWIHIPRPLLHRPQDTRNDRTVPGLPQEKRRRPGQICKELVVKSPGAQQPNHQAAEQSGGDKGNRKIHPLLLLSTTTKKKFDPVVAVRGSKPRRAGKQAHDRYMQAEQGG